MSQQFDCHFVSSFVTTGGVAIPNALVINASNVVTKITGEFGGAAIGAAINFTAISLGDNSFLE
jgi:polyferredoxin